MKNKTLIFLLLLSSSFTFAFPVPGKETEVIKTPIDTNEIVLIIAAVLLTVGAIAYKKLSLKKA